MNDSADQFHSLDNRDYTFPVLEKYPEVSKLQARKIKIDLANDNHLPLLKLNNS